MQFYLPRPYLTVLCLFGVLVAASLAGTVLAHGPEAHDEPAALPAGHGSTEGVLLGMTGAGRESAPAVPCPPDAPVREHSIVALNVQITLNRFLDYDPNGRMFALESEVERVRAEEELNRAARLGEGEPGVSIGLQGDAIQPLVLRVNQGECLRVLLTNSLVEGEPVSLEVHGAGLYLPEIGKPATATERSAIAAPGETVLYEWWVAPSEPEGTHYLHSHADARRQTSHGLFGAVIVEPAGSVHVDPLTGNSPAMGWSAIISPPEGPDFREFVLFYHEIGNERYRHLDRHGRLVVQIDPYTGAYRPGDRAINYRSEPFMNRVQLQQERQGRFDESLAYSSYAFGDPATPIARSYLGDPVKQRLVHGGSEVFHVHHVHGGSIRWQRQPGLGDTGLEAGLDKERPIMAPSTRLDAQSLGPSESFDIVNECGSGGCQQGAGDYLVHCHVAHHYFAGMWMLWRVYNTLQVEGLSRDSLPPLQELPDRGGRVRPAVTSAELVGKTVDLAGTPHTIESDTLAQWVERQLPPPGEPGPYDASVFDWIREGDLYLGEPDGADSWPGHTPSFPNERLPLLFDPLTGRLAYPWLRPHFGRRPPFAPGHGPAPFLEPPRDALAPPGPGEGGPTSVCPEGTTLRTFAIHAISLPVTLNQRLGIVDPSGQLYVLKEDEERVRANREDQVPLAIRGNAGEDCIDIIFKSELPDVRENGFHSKANIHVHLVQFDIQGSDGLTAGFNFEQSVRPFTVEGEQLARAVMAGATSLELTSAERFLPGALVGVGMDQAESFEVRRVVGASGTTLTIEPPLSHEHGEGEIVSTEFVRYRWFPDVQFGTAYFHDHVLALSSWRHGLFGAFIAEPPGSSYRHPGSGAEIRSGPVADIHTDSRLSVDVTGSFRELVLFLQDDNHLTRRSNTTGSSVNLRVEPREGDPAALFSSRVHGDPETPILEARVGDPVAIRGLVAGTNDIHSLSVAGHWFRLEPDDPASRPVNAVHLGISERSDLILPSAGGPQGLPGDYLYRSGQVGKLLEGSWGILRVLAGTAEEGPQPLPGRTERRTAEAVCPEGAPVKEHSLVAIEVPLEMAGGGPGRVVFVPAEHRDAILSGARAVEPWVARVGVGDCLQVLLHNSLPEGQVSLHASMLVADPLDSGGIETGRNPAQAVAPGEERLYTFYAHPEVGETIALITDGASPVDGPRSGLYGAVVVAATGTTYTDPVTGEATSGTGWRSDAHPPGAPSYRDFVLFLQDEDSVIGTAVMPYVEQVGGVVGLNYRSAPIAPHPPGPAGIFGRFSAEDLGDPATPLLEAFPGDSVRISVLVPSGEQMHVFGIEGHRWRLEPRQEASNLLSSQAVGPLQALDLRLEGGAGPPGDYLYGDHREPYRDAGLWGILRVHPPDEGALMPLSRPDR